MIFLWIFLGVVVYFVVGALSGRAMHALMTWLYEDERPGRGQITPREGAWWSFFAWPVIWAYVAVVALLYGVCWLFTDTAARRPFQAIGRWMTREDTTR